MTDIITITEADLARLQSWEFEEVWRAVGYVFRRRAEASKTLPAVPPAIEPAPVPLAPVEAPPDVPPGGAPGEVSKRAEEYSLDIPDVEPAGDAGPSTLEVHQQTCRIHPALDQSGSMPTSGPLVPGREERAETFVIEPAPIGDASLPGHVHRYELGRPEGGVVVGVCECGHRKLHPSDLNGDLSRNGKRSPNPKCPRCGKGSLRDRHGYWCNGCQLEVKAS